MRAVATKSPQAIEHPEALVDVDLPKPQVTRRDLLVEIRAIAVNPVDTKVRKRGGAADGGWRVLGWDAAGIVAEVGPEVTEFKPGDAVFYAGALERPGTNAEFHLVDERIVGRKPESVSFAEAAALPLTAITAWEGLFDRLNVSRAVPGAPPMILIIGGAGGVASIAIQLAKRLTDLTVIGTASRPETAEWVRSLGADHVVNHARPLAEEVAALGLGAPGFVYSTTQTDKHLAAIGDLIAPQGRFVLIDDPGPLDISLFKRKSVSTHWEFMYTRSMFETADMAEQGVLLNEVARLVDEGAIRTTMGAHYGTINAANLRRAHAMLESGRAVGKIVLEGF
jgi:NADPH2:quinone reductase